MEPEVFVPIKQLNGKYHISNYGRVKSFAINPEEGYIKKQKVNKNGYILYVFMTDNRSKTFTESAHRLVAQHFVPNDNPKVNIHVDHADSNRKNNYYKNLSWCTHIENTRKACAQYVLCKHPVLGERIAQGTRHAAELTSCIRGTVQRCIKLGIPSRTDWTYEIMK
jgi:hypothetical protein